MGGGELVYTLIFFALGTFLIFVDIKSISQVEVVLFFAFFILMVIFLVVAVPEIKPMNFLQMTHHSFFLPYGVIMFALGGTAIIPELKEILQGNKKNLQKVIGYGLLGISAFYIIFIIAIFGVTGAATSQDALSGFADALGLKLLIFGYVFGVITTFTSFLTLGLTLKKIFNLDFKVNKHLSWALASFIPLTLFFIGLNSFITVIGLTGAILGGIEALLVMFSYRAYMKNKKMRFHPIYYIVMGLLVFGVVSVVMH